MGAEPAASQQQFRRMVTGFVALAVLAGPITSYTSSAFDSAMHLQTLAGGALSSVLAGIVLLLLSIARRQSMPGAKQWLTLLVLLLPQWLALLLTPPYVRSVPWLHETRWGWAFLISLGAPLWLGLLAALDVVEVAAPRAVAAAAIAGIGAVCLVIPTSAYGVSPTQVPVLLIQLSINIMVVFTWAYARPRLASAGTLAVAGSFLLISAFGDAAFCLLYERGSWQPVEWRGVAVPLLVQAAVIAASWWLWFWLLRRMMLAAFGMRALASWTASTLPGFVLFGFMSWRVDAALGIAVAALVVALRARAAEEQPLALGLRGL